MQTGHWNRPSDGPFTGSTLISLLKNRIESIDWKKAADDVSAFLTARDKELLLEWNRELFTAYIDKLAQYI